jgi:hypothetical protein
VPANAVLQRPSIIIENINDISESRSAATLLAELTLLQKAGQFPTRNGSQADVQAVWTEISIAWRLI